MSILIDKVDITEYVHNLEPGRGFKQSYNIYNLALKPGSKVSADLAPGYTFSLRGLLISDTPANLRTLIDNMGLWLRPRKEKYRLDYNGKIFYARILDFNAVEPNLWATTSAWEAHFASEEPVASDTETTITLAQDTIEDFMNSGVGILLPTFDKTVSGSSITFEMSDIDGASVAYLGSTHKAPTVHSYGSLAHEYEYKLTDSPRCQKWTSGTSQSGNEGGMYWSPSAEDLSAENCYTVWVAVLVDKDLISSARIGLGDGTNIGWVTVTSRISDDVWSWVPVFVREAEKDNGSLNTAAITRVYLAVTPNTDDSIDFYADGQVIARNPAKATIATTSYAGFYNLRTGKFYDLDTGQEVDPELTLQGRPWVRPGCNLLYQNSSATSQYAYVRGGK